jgi:hypothetical protein
VAICNKSCHIKKQKIDLSFAKQEFNKNKNNQPVRRDDSADSG